MALVSLELSAVYARQGRTADVKRLAAEMLPIFQSCEVHREALAALIVFQKAAEMEQLSVGLVEEVTSLPPARADEPEPALPRERLKKMRTRKGRSALPQSAPAHQTDRAGLRTLDPLLLGETDLGADREDLEAFEHGVAVEVDLAAVGGLEEAEAVLREEADHPALRRADGGLHVAPAAARELLDLPLGGVEGVPDRSIRGPPPPCWRPARSRGP